MQTQIYAWERLHKAIVSLAKGSLPVGDRLMGVATNELAPILSDPHIEGMPEDLQEIITLIHKQLMENGSYEKTIASMEYLEMARLIETIVGLYYRVTVAVERSNDQ